jgi:hypothetical protein
MKKNSDTLDTEVPPKLIRKLQAECKAANPSFYRACQKMSDAQLRSLEIEMLEEKVRELRRLPRFRLSPQLQREAAIHEYHLRLIREIEDDERRPRRQIPRYKPRETAAVNAAANFVPGPE